jgi:hypothetical protein
VIFAAYEMMVGRLAATLAFTTLSLFNILRFPLVVLPKAMRALSEALASINRVEEFMLKEVPTDTVGVKKSTSAGVKIVSSALLQLLLLLLFVLQLCTSLAKQSGLGWVVHAQQCHGILATLALFIPRASSCWQFLPADCPCIAAVATLVTSPAHLAPALLLLPAVAACSATLSSSTTVTVPSGSTFPSSALLPASWLPSSAVSVPASPLCSRPFWATWIQCRALLRPVAACHLCRRTPGART